MSLQVGEVKAEVGQCEHNEAVRACSVWLQCLGGAGEDEGVRLYQYSEYIGHILPMH